MNEKIKELFTNQEFVENGLSRFMPALRNRTKLTDIE